MFFHFILYFISSADLGDEPRQKRLLLSRRNNLPRAELGHEITKIRLVLLGGLPDFLSLGPPGRL